MIDNAEQAREVLRQVYDPELGVNIVDLGLVYDIRIEPDLIYVRMTLTTPGCPMHDTIAGGARRALEERSDGRKVEVEVVWEPRWSPEYMSQAAKEQLGFF